MKENREFVFTQKEVEEMLRSCIPFQFPKDAKIYFYKDREWSEQNTYNRDTADCIKISFSPEDLVKEKEKETKAAETGGEQDWDSLY